MRYQLVHLIVGKVALLFAGIDQFFYVIVLVFKSQEACPQILQFARGGACGNVVSGRNMG
jgi:hypothetical protein